MTGGALPLVERLEVLASAAAAAEPHAAVALAAITADESVTVCRGSADRARESAATTRTRFEIGSVTKTFTALLLAEMAARGEVRYDDPIDVYLPPTAVHRTLRGAVTLRHLSTHTSGLPRLPPDFLPLALPSWYTNPYEAYSPWRLLRSLSHTRVRRRPGTRLRYSNFGVGLLGHILGTAAGGDYGDVLAARVLRPLGLTDTTCDPELPQATGYRNGRPRPPWRIPGLPGAGALRSSAEDLLRYLRAHLAPDESPAGATLREALGDVARPLLIAPSGDRLSLVWNLRDVGACDLLFHSGGTRGFTAFVGFAPQARVGIAALTNTTPTLRGEFIRSAYLTLRGLAGVPAEPVPARGPADAAL